MESWIEPKAARMNRSRTPPLAASMRKDCASGFVSRSRSPGVPWAAGQALHRLADLHSFQPVPKKAMVICFLNSVEHEALDAPESARLPALKHCS